MYCVITGLALCLSIFVVELVVLGVKNMKT